ncbi:hypothetical protein A9B99_04865 [Mangrovibacter phragmitis]|uniref:Uncharacterized protein n=1 Tax=Mangrovibacter phragmitis TaxID=1691903 RepID=A0A1B7L9L6_9ENTR|nr:hypothetical protein A9B99_04865 [Mangrovibacter phragmitis]
MLENSAYQAAFVPQPAPGAAFAHQAIKILFNSSRLPGQAENIAIVTRGYARLLNANQQAFSTSCKG